MLGTTGGSGPDMNVIIAIARNNRTSKTSCPVLIRLSRCPAAAAHAFEKVY